MAYYDREQLTKMGFMRLGKGVKISDRASIYDPGKIEIGDYSRIDDYCVISGRISVGAYCHITPMCLVAGGEPGVYLSDFCTLAYGVKMFAQSDDYTGESLVNSSIPRRYKKEIFKPVIVHRHVVFGAGTVVLPGVEVAEGCSFGAMTLVNKSTSAWGMYVGIPARRFRERKRDLLELEKKFREDLADDSL